MEDGSVVLDGERLGFPQLSGYQFTLREQDMHEIGANTTYFAGVRATDPSGETVGNAHISCSHNGAGMRTIYVGSVSVAVAHRRQGIASAMIELGRWYYGEELAVTSAGPEGDTDEGQALMRSITQRVLVGR